MYVHGKSDNSSDVVLETKVVVLRCLEDKNKVLVMVATKKSAEFQDFFLLITIKYFDSSELVME